MRLLSVTLLLAGLLLLIYYRREKKKPTGENAEADPPLDWDDGIIKRIKAIDSVGQREQQLQKVRDSREENRLEEFDYQTQEWEPPESPIDDEDKEVIGHFMEQILSSAHEEAHEDQSLAGGEYIDEQWIDQHLNTGVPDTLKGTEVYIKQKKNIEEAIASGRYNEAVSKLLTF